MAELIEIESQGTHRGFQWVALINRAMGLRCGYVLIPEGHPWYGKPFDSIQVQVHGGLTFGEHTTGGGLFQSGFWIGFDCGHGMDQPDFDEMPPEAIKLYRIGEELGKSWFKSIAKSLGIDVDDESCKELLNQRKIRGVAYVESQCKNLASAAADISDLQNLYEKSSEKLGS